MKLNNIKKLLCAFALVLTTNAQALIVDLHERDYLTLGDGLITYDSTTGLEWLDVTFTAGLSMLEVEANPFIWAEGWDWVTTDQMETIFNHAKNEPLWGNLPYNSYEHILAYPLANLFGPTSFSFSPESISSTVYGYSRNFEFDIDSLEYTYAVIQGKINLDIHDPYYPGFDDWPCDEDCLRFRTELVWSETDTLPYFGAWLVRVPEPPAILLFGIGMIGLVGFTKRRKAA